MENSWRFRLFFGLVFAALTGSGVFLYNATASKQWSDTHDEYYTATTSDGFVLPLYRFKPTAPVQNVPVLLCHGLGANRYNMMAPGPVNLARWLAAKGHDVFVAELRGAGKSVELNHMNTAPGAWDFNFDTYARKDGPALLRKVAAVTGSQQVDWVGHSMGGMLSYALAGSASDLSGVSLRRAVSVAGPAMFKDLPARTIALMTGGVRLPFARLPNDLLTAFTPMLYPWAFQENDPAIGFKTNYDPAFVRGLMKFGTTGISRQLVMQFLHWYRSGELKSLDGRNDYLAGLKNSPVAFLFLGGSKDLLTPKASLRLAFDMHGGEKKLLYFGREEGHGVDFGHGDILLGLSAPTEVYPHIADWLVRTTTVSSH